MVRPGMFMHRLFAQFLVGNDGPFQFFETARSIRIEAARGGSKVRPYVLLLG